MRGLKQLTKAQAEYTEGRIFYRCVDWNTDVDTIKIQGLCRIFYRCVDWNKRAITAEGSLYVASFTDAWIETFLGRCSGLYVSVASFTDAWIETERLTFASVSRTSHLLQMRGLKPSPGGIAKKLLRSHLLQMRGLKHWEMFLFWKRDGSHLLQMRGLKLGLIILSSLSKSRIFYRCVDWNSYRTPLIHCLFRRIFYRCVDWNKILVKYRPLTEVASFTDAWIETSLSWMRKANVLVASFTDAWIETEINDINEHVNLVASFTDAWIETSTATNGSDHPMSHLLQMRGLKQGYCMSSR